MGLGKIFLRHTNKFFLFFEGGDKLLSVKWVNVGASSGNYEFFECILGKTVKVLSKQDVEWADYENFLSSWLSSHAGFVFDENKVFLLVWLFFVKRNDRFLSDNFDPFLVLSSVDLKSESAASAAKKILNKMRSCRSPAVHFWDNKANEIINKYAFWLSDWH
jgi:hypothetical protein